MPAARVKYIVTWLLKPFHSNDRQYWKVVLLCFTAAATFWLLNALNKNYTNIRTSYPLRFVYDKEKYIPLKPLPEAVEINVSGKGWKLLRKYLMLDVRPTEIAINYLPRYKYLTGSALRPSIAGVLDGLQLNFVVTDTVQFAFDRRIRRRLPLAIDSTQFVIPTNRVISSPIVINPDSVVFDGPASIVDTLPSPFLVKLPVDNIDRSFKRFVPLEYPNRSLVKASVTDVEVSFAVSPLTWQQIAVSPLIKNISPEKAVQIQPAVITVQFGFQQTNAAPISPEQFEVVVDYATFNPADSSANVILTRKPAQVKKATIEPNKVKVLL